jgi:phenylpropionate dioxygenase-like ring-hydroxylating dioxygenase large terminal subunit
VIDGGTEPLRAIPDPPAIEHARTLPASWYSDAAFFEHERQRVFRSDWVCVGITDELPPDGGWVAITVGGLPILLVRDRDGELRGFVNVCRHRAAPLCDEGGSGSGSVIRCPYHAWIYRLDGSLAKAGGIGTPAGFDVGDHALRSVGVTVWRRFVFVRAGTGSGPHVATFDPGRLGAALAGAAIEELELTMAESDVRTFNWKVLLENYSENYHTPFVHPDIDTTGVEDYPMVSEGRVLYAWDRLRRPGGDDDETIRATKLSGEPGWERLFRAATDRPYDVGSYLTVWPNLMINLFPDAMLAMWMEPIDATSTRVERRLYLRIGTSDANRESIAAAHRLVHDQDVDICARVQRSHNAGIDADGVLATVEERGVYFVHEHLRAAVGAGV